MADSPQVNCKHPSHWKANGCPNYKLPPWDCKGHQKPRLRWDGKQWVTVSDASL